MPPCKTLLYTPDLPPVREFLGLVAQQNGLSFSDDFVAVRHRPCRFVLMPFCFAGAPVVVAAVVADVRRCCAPLHVQLPGGSVGPYNPMDLANTTLSAAAGNSCVTGNCTSLGLDCLPVRRLECGWRACAATGGGGRREGGFLLSITHTSFVAPPPLPPCLSVRLGSRQRHPVRFRVEVPKPNPGRGHVRGRVYGT